MNLTEYEIRQRLVRLRNLEKLHVKARERIVCLEKENKELRKRIKELEDQNKDQNTKIEAISFQFEQIKNKLFGKKPIIERILHKKDKVIRDTDSYIRPIPERITDTKLHIVTECNNCHGLLKKKSIRVFFEEDIPLPIQKIVTKHEVWIGYCNVCRIQSSGYPIPSKKVVLGYNVKKYICILSIANRFSHNQIQNHLKDVFDLDISIGEIGNILNDEALNLRPEYQALKESVISQTATHYDETSWDVQKEEQGKFAWVATGTENNDTVFSLGRSRGKGNIDDIGKAKVGISDDYGAYKNTFEQHQLCWAHPNRKLRDLAESSEVSEEKKGNCKKTYLQFSKLYRDIRNYHDSEISTKIGMRFQSIFKKITENHSLDPTVLTKLKISLLKNTEKYFTFLKYPSIPIDNNKAERALRHLVLKRKISFGSKTQRGAETTSILASVILSLKWNNPDNWFKTYLQLGG
jgi:hypothetical protein